jgi:polyhydroxyalkanoate synthesis regulator phasin
MQKSWDQMTDKEKLEFLKDALTNLATKQNLTGVLSQVQELQGAISELEKRVNALENRPAVGC